MLKGFPPYSAIKLSTSVTFAPRSTRRRASDEPMKPSPPVTRTSAPEKILPSKATMDCRCQTKRFPITFRAFLTKFRQTQADDSPMTSEQTIPSATPELSFVIPVYNGSRTIGGVVDLIHAAFASTPFEIILVNDGSEDDSELICARLAEQFPRTVAFVNLSRNFGEHN